MSDSTKIYELKITLSGIKPSIYRTIQIEEDKTFFELHAAVQRVQIKICTKADTDSLIGLNFSFPSPAGALSA